MASLSASCFLAQAAIVCSNINMKHIPALTDPGLTMLYLAENEIAKIPAHMFLGLPSLEWLDLSKNRLDTQGLHPHAFKNRMQLKWLNLGGNLLSTVPALSTSLQELKFDDNLLLQGFRAQPAADAGSGREPAASWGPLPPAFQVLHSLLYLRLGQNRLQAIPPGLPALLQELHLGTHLIEDVWESVLNCSCSLSVLVLSNNQLQEDRLAPHAWINLPKLETLDLSHNRLCTEGVHGVSFLGLRTSLAELLRDHTLSAY